MNLQLEKPYVEAMLNRFSDLGFLAEQLKFGNRAEVPFQRFSVRKRVWNRHHSDT